MRSKGARTVFLRAMMCAAPSLIACTKLKRQNEKRCANNRLCHCAAIRSSGEIQSHSGSIKILFDEPTISQRSRSTQSLLPGWTETNPGAIFVDTPIAVIDTDSALLFALKDHSGNESPMSSG